VLDHAIDYQRSKHLFPPLATPGGSTSATN
jgi:hypothetical protein